MPHCYTSGFAAGGLRVVDPFAQGCVAGMFCYVLPFVPGARAEDFAGDFAAEGLTLVPGVHGTEAVVESAAQ